MEFTDDDEEEDVIESFTESADAHGLVSAFSAAASLTREDDDEIETRSSLSGKAMKISRKPPHRVTMDRTNWKIFRWLTPSGKEKGVIASALPPP